jgi:hypothetical protein
VVALTLGALNVLLAAEAEAGMEARAIPEERMKAMRRMGNVALLTVHLRTLASRTWRPTIDLSNRCFRTI